MVTGAMQVKGVRGTALQFDGRSSSARCLGSSAMGTTAGITLEAWVKLDKLGFSSYPAVLRKDGSYALRFAGDSLGLIIWMDGVPVTCTATKKDWEVGRWYHVAGTYDGSSFRVYVDGTEVGSLDKPWAQPLDSSPIACYVGSSPGQPPLAGTVDEARIWGRALSPREIAASWQAGMAALEAGKSESFQPTPVGPRVVVFRKPRPEVRIVQPGFLWLDAEDFEDYGGWSLDTQFVHLMGSGYLLAAGAGKPVADATTKVTLEQPGRYRLWVRARNWVGPGAPGRFQVLVNGKPADRTFGMGELKKWVWEDGGSFDLPAGEVSLALHDLTGYFGRCDALVLTTDPNYRPPDALEAIAQERARLTGISLEPTVVGDYDVVVVGAGTAGCCAAIAAARGGAKTALIQDRPVLGGNASDEAGVGVNGAGSSKPNARESGIIEEVGRYQCRYGYRKPSQPFADIMAQEPNLKVFLNERVVAAEKTDAKTIASVRSVNTLTGRISVYRGRIFIDCTGDGWVGYYAGAQYRLGREAKSEFNESLAPEQADNITMSGCIMGGYAISYRAEDTGKPAPYVRPEWAPKIPPPVGFGRGIRSFTGGQWWLEHAGDIDDCFDAEWARDELIRITYGYWDYIKNEWPEREKATNYEITWVPFYDAKRESRRLVGDYILNQNDVMAATMFPDRISYGGWPLDVHHPLGIYSGEAGSFWCDPPVPIYSIPYRTLYSANIDNLMMAGRCMSVTHIALGSVRVQGTLATTGQAAGTAAAMAIRYHTTPRGIYEKHMTELQQTLLRDDQYIPQMANEDPADLARRATVTASSVANYQEFGRESVRPGEMHELNMNRAMLFPWGQKTRLDSVFALLHSTNDAPTKATLHLRGAKESGDFSSTEDLAVAEATVPPQAESWVEFKVNVQTDSPFLYAWFPATPGVSWRLMTKCAEGGCRAYGNLDQWTVNKGQYYALYTAPAIRVSTPDLYSPAYVINGVARIVGKQTNMWASDPTQPMPQWLELAWPEKVRLSSVYLTFDTDLNAPYHNVALVPECVRDYELSYWDGTAWQSLVKERGNFQRHRVHRFAPVTTDRLRLTVTATNGDKSARVFELRAYGD